jgi:hypothetical protein
MAKKTPVLGVLVTSGIAGKSAEGDVLFEVDAKSTVGISNSIDYVLR